MKKIVLLAFVLVLSSTAMVGRFIRPVKAGGPIYIRADGSIEGTTDIMTADNVTYTFTDNIFNQSIIVERNNTVVDGAGYTLQGTGEIGSKGIALCQGSNVTIKNIKIKAFFYGFSVECSNNIICGNKITNNTFGIYLRASNSIVSGNTITNNLYGIWLEASSNNTISGNKITANNTYGIVLSDSSDNSVSGNNLTNNSLGIWLLYSSSNRICGNKIMANDSVGIQLSDSSGNSITGNNLTTNGSCILLWDSTGNTISGNTITKNGRGVFLFTGFHPTHNNRFYHNNFINNNKQVDAYPSYLDNSWDNGFEGNYWSNYTGVDSNHDGIGDSHHVIDTYNKDHYPLMGPFSSFNTSRGYHVNVISNSTIEDFQYFESNCTIKMYVSNVTANQTYGFCRICIPHALIDGAYHVTINGAEPHYINYTVCDDGENRWIYFSYQHSILEILIVPEFPTWTSVLLMLIVLTVAVGVCKRKLLKTRSLK